MSAYVVDPRTIDYLVAWATRHQHDHTNIRTPKVPTWRTLADVPREYHHAVTGHPQESGYALELVRLTANDIGRILMVENIRSVSHRYPNEPGDSLPGPIDQRRIWRYEYRRVDTEALRPDWVVSSCRCLEYQSCETPDYRSTAAYAVMQAIREDAIRAWVEDAPWGVTDEHLQQAVAS